MKFACASMAILALSGCLTTRAELRTEPSEGFTTAPNSAPNPAPNGSPTAARAVASGTPAPESVKPLPPQSSSDELDEQLRQLTGRVEVLENQLNTANANQAADKLTSTADKQKLDERFQAFEDALKKLDQQLQALTEDVTKLKTAPPPPPPPPPPAPLAPTKGRGDYDEGDRLFTAKKWKDAIVAFSRYRDGNPKGHLYAPATLKIGVAFHELGMKDEAKAFYEEVTLKFPRSAEAKKASQHLRSDK